MSVDNRREAGRRRVLIKREEVMDYPTEEARGESERSH